MSVDKDDSIKNDESPESDDENKLTELKNSFAKARSLSLQTSVVQQQSSFSSSSSSSLSTSTSSHQSNATVVTKSTSTATATKSKFQSFLQQPDMTVGGHSHGNTFLSVQSQQQQQQKFVRQFVRSASAHSSDGAPTVTSSVTSAAAKSIKCLRSSSQQMDDDGIIVGGQFKIQAQQENAVLISKSADNFETKVIGTGNRNQLTLAGGFLAPPNRKLTILSPGHSAPGLYEILKRQGRSPCSPKITFPDDNELFL